MPGSLLRRAVLRKILSVFIIHSVAFGYSSARDYIVTGTVTDMSGLPVPNARVSMMHGTIEYSALSGTDGNYSLRISGIYADVSIFLNLAFPTRILLLLR